MNSKDKYIYIIDYSGLIVLIAMNDTEALELLSNEESIEIKDPNDIMESIITADKLKLVDDYESGIIDALIV
jgi:hypothetical protein